MTFIQPYTHRKHVIQTNILQRNAKYEIQPSETIGIAYRMYIKHVDIEIIGCDVETLKHLSTKDTASNTELRTAVQTKHTANVPLLSTNT